VSSFPTTDAEPAVAERRFTRDVLWNVASLAVLGGTGMVINAFVLAVQGPATLGAFNQVFAVFVVVTQFAVGGLQFSALKHCARAREDRASCSQIAASAVLLVCLVGGTLSLAVFLVHGVVGSVLQSPDVAVGLAMVAPGILCFSLNKVLLMVLNGLRHMRAFAVFQSLRYLVLLTTVVSLTLLGYPGSWLPLSLTLTEIAVCAALICYVSRLFPVIISPFSNQLRPWYGRHLSFGLRGFLSGALIELNTRVDVLMLGVFTADAVVGIYSFAATFAEGFAQLTVIVRQNLDPIFGRAFAENRLERIGEAARAVRRKFWPLMAGAGLLLMAGYPVLIWLFSAGGQTWRSWPVLCILVVGVIVSAGYRSMAGVFIAGDRPGAYTLLIAGTAIANIVLNLLLIPMAGLYGAALATSAACVLESMAIVILAWKLLAVRL